MPTGYTDKLYKGEQTFNDFALRCARAFGATIMQRDESLDSGLRLRMPQTEYHEIQIEKATQELREARKWTAVEADAAAEADYAERFEAWAKDRQVSNERKRRYEAMHAEVSKWTPPTDDHQALKEFMLEQLRTSIKFDAGWMPKPEAKGGTQFRADKVRRATESLQYHTKQIEDEYRRAAESNTWIVALAESIGATVA